MTTILEGNCFEVLFYPHLHNRPDLFRIVERANRMSGMVRLVFLDSAAEASNGGYGDSQRRTVVTPQSCR